MRYLRWSQCGTAHSSLSECRLSVESVEINLVVCSVFRLQWRGYGQTDIITVDCGDEAGGIQLDVENRLYVEHIIHM